LVPRALNTLSAYAPPVEQFLVSPFLPSAEDFDRLHEAEFQAAPDLPRKTQKVRRKQQKAKAHERYKCPEEEHRLRGPVKRLTL